MTTPLPNDPAETEFVGTIAVSLSDIEASPTNPRETFNADEMAELTESVRKHGVLQPILLRPWPADYQHAAPLPTYELVAGERRWRAAKAAGLSVIEAKVRNLSDNEVLEIQIIENLCRADLHPLEEAIGYERMMQSYGYTAESLAEKVHKSKAYIYARCKLTALCHESRKAFMAGNLSASTALLIARIPSIKMQEKATREIIDPDYMGEMMSVRRAQKHLQQNYMLRLVEAPFPIGVVDLIKKAGSCEHCPKRTGNQPPDLFEDVKSADVCTDPECYDEKRQAHVKNMAADATAKGQTVITGKTAEKLFSYGSSLAQNSGYTSLDERCYEVENSPTYRELLADKIPEVKLVECASKGVMLEVIEDKQLAAAMVAAGVKRFKDKREEEAKKIAAKVAPEQAFRDRLFSELRTSLDISFKEGGPEFNSSELKLIATTLIDQVYDDARKIVQKLWWPGEKLSAEQIDEKIIALPDSSICLLIMDCLLAASTIVSQYNLDRDPTKLLEAADRAGISVDEIRKTLAAEARKKASSPSKAAQAGEPSARGKTKRTAKKAAQAQDQTANEAAPAGDEVPKEIIGESPAIAGEGNETPSGEQRKFAVGDRVRVRMGATEQGFPLASAGMVVTITEDEDQDGYYVAEGEISGSECFTADQIEMNEKAVAL